MYMKPGSSEAPKGRASSDISAEAVWASTESGMKSFICAVCEAVDFRERREFLAEDVFCDAVRCCFEVRFGGTEADVFWTGRGCGREGRDSWTSWRGTEKQQHIRDCFGCGFGLGAVCFRPSVSLLYFFFSCKSTNPNLSASVSKLVRPSKIGVEVALGPGLECADIFACSRCCQQ